MCFKEHLKQSALHLTDFFTIIHLQHIHLIKSAQLLWWLCCSVFVSSPGSVWWCWLRAAGHWCGGSAGEPESAAAHAETNRNIQSCSLKWDSPEAAALRWTVCLHWRNLSTWRIFTEVKRTPSLFGCSSLGHHRETEHSSTPPLFLISLKEVIPVHRNNPDDCL